MPKLTVTTVELVLNSCGFVKSIGDTMLEAIGCDICCDGGICPDDATLTATVTPDGCSPVSFTLEQEVSSEFPVFWIDNEDTPMGSCACPDTPTEDWEFSAGCDAGVWTLTFDAPTGFSTINNITVVSTDPLLVTADGEMDCAGTVTSITIEITSA